VRGDLKFAINSVEALTREYRKTCRVTEKRTIKSGSVKKAIRRLIHLKKVTKVKDGPTENEYEREYQFSPAFRFMFYFAE